MTNPTEMVQRAAGFAQLMQRRRSVREFSPDPVPREVIEACVRAAGAAPSGANRQPWHFVVVTDPQRRRRIREAAEEVERRFYEDTHRHEWHAALDPLGTTWKKPFLTDSGALICVFSKPYDLGSGGERIANYYVAPSVGIATGILVTALHTAGLGTLTYTPMPNEFLRTILDRGENERPFMIVVTGWPAPDYRPPIDAGEKKPIDQILTLM